MGGDNPLVTPEGHFVLDVIFTTPIVTAGLPIVSILERKYFQMILIHEATQFVFEDRMSMNTAHQTMWDLAAAEVVENLESIPGVMGHGLLMDVA